MADPKGDWVEEMAVISRRKYNLVWRERKKHARVLTLHLEVKS